MAVVGYSFGGMVAQEFALRYPEKISTLALICTSSGGEGGASFPLHEIQHLDPYAKATQLLELSDSRQNAQWRYDNKEYFEMLRDFAIHSDAIGGEEEGHQMGKRRQLEARRQHNTFARLQNIKHSVYLIAGKYDQLCLPAHMEKMADQLPNAVLKVFEGGHQCMQQDSQAYPWLIEKMKRSL